MLDPTDRLDLIELTHRYFRGVDSKDAAVLATALTDDIVAEHSMVGSVRGLAAFTDVIRRLPAPVVVTQHQLSNHEVEADGEGARVRAYLYAQHAVRSGEGVVLLPGGGRYEFRCRRTQAGWRIWWLRNTVTWGDPRLEAIFKPL
jgi:ketosteroid isomerase-like protein